MLKKMGIRQKLLLVILPLAFMILLLIAFMWLGELNVLKQAKGVYYEQLKALTDKLITADRDFYQAELALEEMNIAKKRGDSTGEASYEADYEENAKQVQDGIAEIDQLIAADAYLYHEFRGEGGSESAKELIEKTEDGFAKWKEAADRGDTDNADPLFAAARDGINGLEDMVELYATYQDQKLEKSIHLALAITVVIILIVIALLTLLTIFVIRYIRINVVKIAGTMEQLAEGHFVPLNESDLHDDEMGHMIHNTNQLINKLGEIIGNIKVAVERVNQASSELAETAGQISDTTDGISEAVQGIATGAVQQAEEIQNANVNVEKISDAVSTVMDNTNTLNKTASDMENESRQAADEMEKLRASSADMSNRINEITSRINATSDAVNNINEKVAAITSIATQTNLLALNASIEAARAGDAGRGFAVVAEEIGKLADDSAASADQIRKEMEALLGESHAAVKTAQEVQETNNAQQKVIENTVESISVLIDAIGQTVSGVANIDESAKDSEAAKSVVVDAMSSLSAISEENAASTEETSASMEELNATINVLSASADSMHAIAGQLAEDISFFK